MQKVQPNVNQSLQNQRADSREMRSRTLKNAGEQEEVIGFFSTQQLYHGKAAGPGYMCHMQRKKTARLIEVGTHDLPILIVLTRRTEQVLKVSIFDDTKPLHLKIYVQSGWPLNLSFLDQECFLSPKNGICVSKRAHFLKPCSTKFFSIFFDFMINCSNVELMQNTSSFVPLYMQLIL